jgi:NitT/TauT family transport system permease protein
LPIPSTTDFSRYSPAMRATGQTGAEEAIVRSAADSPAVSRQSDLLAGAIVVLAIVVVMQIASLLVPPYVVPPPLAVATALIDDLRQDWLHVAVTLARLGAAVLAAMTIGTAVGVVMGMSPRLRPYLRALVVIDTGIPALSWMLVAVFWFRGPELRIFFIMAVILVPFYALTVHDGIRALPKDWLEMCESFRPSRAQVLRLLILPHILPYVLTTTRSMIGYATRMLIFAEVIGSALGIGARMGLAQATFHIEDVFAWTVLLVVLNLALQAAITATESRLLRWRPAIEVR